MDSQFLYQEPFETVTTDRVRFDVVAPTVVVQTLVERELV